MFFNELKQQIKNAMWNNSDTYNQIFCSAIMQKQYKVRLNFMTCRFL